MEHSQKEISIAASVAVESIILIMDLIEQKSGKKVEMIDVIEAIKVEGNIQNLYNKVSEMSYKMVIQ